MNLLRRLSSRSTLYTNHPQLTHLLLITLLALPALWPLYVVNLPATGDGHLHLMRLTVLDRYLARGEVYPRWAAELALGYGHPVFTYYAPSTYALIEIFHGLGLPHVEGYRLAIALFVLAAGYGMYYLAREFYPSARVGSWPALLAAVAYLYAPYLLTTAHFRGALAETGAQALLPWILWSFRRLYYTATPSRALLVAAFSLGAMAVTHNITLLFTPLLVVGYLATLVLDDPSPWLARLRRLGWILLACGLAMGISLFFWLPMAVERHYLSQFSYGVSQMLVHDHLWSWANFLDWHWRFAYTERAPFQLGLVQSGLALLGALLLYGRGWRWERWFWLGLTAVTIFGMSRPAEPIWMGNQYLLITQFPWRLLTFTSLSLAIFTGAVVERLRAPWVQMSGGLLLLAVVIFCNRPTTAELETNFAHELNFSLPAVNHYELDSGAFGASLGREFMPSATDDFVITDVPATLALSGVPTVTLQGADPHTIQLQIDTPSELKLRFTNFYFPGWQALLDGQELAIAPSTLQAVATLVIPAGQHQLEYRWQGTRLQWVSTYLTLLTLLGVTIYAFAVDRQRGRRPWCAVVPLLLLGGGAWATFHSHPAPPAPQRAATPQLAPGLTMLGYYVEQEEADKLYLWPYWFVERPQPDLTFRWSIVDGQGVTVSEKSAYPYFNTQRATGWSAGMVVDDAYQLPLPPGLPAGDYTLQLQPLTPDGAMGAPQTVGSATVAAVPAPPSVAMQPLALRLADQAYLDGYTVQINRQPARLGDTKPVVQPGDRLEVRLYWRAQRSLLQNYHSFIHLVDWAQRPLLQQDQLPGPFWSPPMLWDSFTPQPDIYRFKIPADTASGLYMARVGLYGFTGQNFQDFSDQERLPIVDATGAAVGDGVNLPPFKVYNPHQFDELTLATQPVNATFAGLGTLVGYQLTPATAQLAAGDALTLTLVYQSNGPASLDYTQFIQLYSSASGLAGQTDREPLGGANPTSAWVAGETVVERVSVVTNAAAAPGAYRLQVGFYDRTTGARVAVTGADGMALPDHQVPLTTLELTAPHAQGDADQQAAAKEQADVQP